MNLNQIGPNSVTLSARTTCSPHELQDELSAFHEFLASEQVPFNEVQVGDWMEVTVNDASAICPVLCYYLHHSATCNIHQAWEVIAILNVLIQLDASAKSWMKFKPMLYEALMYFQEMVEHRARMVDDVYHIVHQRRLTELTYKRFNLSELQMLVMHYTAAMIEMSERLGAIFNSERSGSLDEVLMRFRYQRICYDRASIEQLRLGSVVPENLFAMEALDLISLKGELIAERHQQAPMPIVEKMKEFFLGEVPSGYFSSGQCLVDSLLMRDSEECGGQQVLHNMLARHYDIQNNCLQINACGVGVDLVAPVLLHAISLGADIDVVKHFLSLGADVNAQGVLTENGEEVFEVTALMLAARQGKAAVVQCLLECGADRDSEDALGRTAINYAANDETCKLLMPRVLLHRLLENAVVKQSLSFEDLQSVMREMSVSSVLARTPEGKTARQLISELRFKDAFVDSLLEQVEMFERYAASQVSSSEACAQESVAERPAAPPPLSLDVEPMGEEDAARIASLTEGLLAGPQEDDSPIGWYEPIAAGPGDLPPEGWFGREDDKKLSKRPACGFFDTGVTRYQEAAEQALEKLSKAQKEQWPALESCYSDIEQRLLELYSLNKDISAARVVIKCRGDLVAQGLNRSVAEGSFADVWTGYQKLASIFMVEGDAALGCLDNNAKGWFELASKRLLEVVYHKQAMGHSTQCESLLQDAFCCMAMVAQLGGDNNGKAFGVFKELVAPLSTCQSYQALIENHPEEVQAVSDGLAAKLLSIDFDGCSLDGFIESAFGSVPAESLPAVVCA